MIRDIRLIQTRGAIAAIKAYDIGSIEFLRSFHRPIIKVPLQHQDCIECAAAETLDPCVDGLAITKVPGNAHLDFDQRVCTVAAGKLWELLSMVCSEIATEAFLWNSDEPL